MHIPFLQSKKSSFPMASAFGFVFGIETEVDQRVVALAGLHDDVAAATAIATGRSTSGNKFFAPEGHTTVAAASGLDSDYRLIDKHRSL